MCSSYQKRERKCEECHLGVQSVLDLSKVFIEYLSAGDTIVGNLEYLGWAVVKGVEISMNLHITLQ